MRPKKDLKKLAVQLAGLNTIGSVAKTLKVKKKTATNLLYKLRKLGLVETFRGKGKIRMYHVHPTKPVAKGVGLYDFVSRNSKVKVLPRYELYVHAKLTLEDALIKCLQLQDFRLILAALGLFSKIKNWALLSKLARQSGLGRKIGALYDLAKKVMRVRRADARVLKSWLKSNLDSKYIIPSARSKDWPTLETKWKVYIPFSRQDLEEYK